MIHLGFTGTRYGMSLAQQYAVRNLILQLIDEVGTITVHHGACVGADADFHKICMEYSPAYVRQIHQHIPIDKKLKATLYGGLYEEPKPYGERNQDIVNASDYVIGAPLDDSRRGGTWQTIGMAQRKGNLWRVVYPTGVVING